MGWRGCPVAEKVAGGLAGGNALPGMGAVGWACSVGKYGRRARGAKEVAGWVTRTVLQGEESSWEGLGRVQAVAGTVGSMG